MKKKLGSISHGKRFTYGGQQFVVLEQMGNGVFCHLARSRIFVPFHNSDDAPMNNYKKSSLRLTIENLWINELLANGGSRDDMIPFDVDLRPTDQSEGYGMLKNVPAAPLTLWQYGKYKDIIPLNEDELWWLVTPCTCPKPNLQRTYNAKNVWYIESGGDYGDYFYCSESYGLRPALKLTPELLVSVGGNDEDERENGQCNNHTIDLSYVNTASLLREIERRVVASTRDTGPNTGDAECMVMRNVDE